MQAKFCRRVLSIQRSDTPQGSSALHVCWTLSSGGFQLGSCHTWEFLFLCHSRPLGPALPRSTRQQYFPSQSRNKQQYTDTCSFSIRYITEQELKPLTIVPPALIAIIYSLYCAMWTLRCVRNLQTVRGYFKGSFLLLSPSIWFPSEETDLTTIRLYSRQIYNHRPPAPSTWQHAIETPAYYRIVVSLPAA